MAERELGWRIRFGAQAKNDERTIREAALFRLDGHFVLKDPISVA